MNIFQKLKALFNNNELARNTFLKTIDRGAEVIYSMKQEVTKKGNADHFETEFRDCLAMSAELRLLISDKDKMDTLVILAMNIFNQKIGDAIAHFTIHKQNPNASLNEEASVKNIRDIVLNNPKNPEEALEQIMKVPGVVGAKVVDMKTGREVEVGDIPGKKETATEASAKDRATMNKPKRAD
jgi:hypothetical protein